MYKRDILTIFCAENLNYLYQTKFDVQLEYDEL